MSYKELYDKAQVPGSPITSFSDMQKKMGLINALLSKTDDAALVANPFAYHFPDTPRTAMMEILIMDSMDIEGWTRFRSMYAAALGSQTPFCGIAVKSHGEVWREKTMYPNLFTVETIKSADAREKLWETDEPLARVAQVMRARFMIGALFRAKAKISDLDQVRAEVGSYIAHCTARC